jgi:Na+/phosphate symporter
VMISKLIEMTRLLSKSAYLPSPGALEKCEAMAREVHQQEKMLTRNLVSSDVHSDVMKGVIRFPYRLERVGDLLESILNCFRIKARDGVPFTEKAHAEMDNMFAVLLDMMVNLRDAFRLPNKVILAAVVRQGANLTQMIEDHKLAHWERLEAGFCAVEASSMYRDILDSAKGINEYLVKMATTLEELGQASGAST